MYGQNAATLRDALSELLSHHRVQHRIGGPHPPYSVATTTVQEREKFGEQIARYRHSVLTWCALAVAAANPHLAGKGLTITARSPAEELHQRLHAAITDDRAGLPTMAELTTTQPFELIELWRHAARASALGEHDFTAGVGHGTLSTAQSLVLVHDAAEITRALRILDRRYAAIPGWQQLKNTKRLGMAAQACTDSTRYRDLDHSIDTRGWHPPAQLITGPALPGAAGLLQAQHNLLVHLSAIPDAHSLRLVMDSQRVVSLHSARNLAHTDPAAATRWEHRTDLYGKLIRASRDLAGLLGNGGLAAGQGAIAASRAEHLRHNALTDPAQFEHLHRISTRIDHRINESLRRGIDQRLYFQRVNVLGLDDRDGTLVYVTRQRYRPVLTEVRGELLQLIHSQLRPAPAPRQRHSDATQHRLDFRDAIDQPSRPRGAIVNGHSL